MIPKVKIKAKYNENSSVCFGEIGVLSVNKHTAYIYWQFYIESIPIAGRYEHYFIDTEVLVMEDLIARIINNIEKYRMSRKKIFSEVSILG